MYKKIGIIGAEEHEITLLRANFQGKSFEIAHLVFYEGTIKDIPVVLVRSGIGKVNAAICTQILITRFGVDCIINTGTAGALGEGVKIFDIVISTDAVQHDVNAVHFGYELGHVPQTPSPFWQADLGLREKAVAAFSKLKSAGSIPKDVNAYCGRIASGDIFVAENEQRDFIIKTFQPLCTEMEGAAIAQVASLNNCPFTIIRSMSDSAGKNDKSFISYEAFSKEAAKTASALVLQLLKTL